jgi:hypothetical protein
VQCSALSDTISVTIRVIRLEFGFVNVNNLPPPSNKNYNPGSAVPLAWQWTLNGVVIDTPDADSKPSISIVRPGGGTLSFTPADPGSSSFQYNSVSKTHQFNWQTKEANGSALPSGTYQVTVKSGKTGQSFGPFAVKLK